MESRRERWRSTLLAVVSEVRREDVTFMAASIAYHGFVSMLPVLVLLTLVLTAVGGERLTAEVVRLTAAFLPRTGQRVVVDALRRGTDSVGLSLVGLAVLLWGASKVFRAMDAAFAEMYDTERELSLVGQLRDALVVVVALAAAGVGAVALGTLFRVPDAVPFAPVLDGLVAVAGLAVAFFPMYYVFPNVDVSVRMVLPGVVLAAVGWVGLEALFGVYVSLSSKPDVYGFVGTVLLLVIWLYVGSLVLLTGVAVNATLEGRGSDRRPWKRGRRTFGREVNDLEGFERRLERLVTHAREAGVDVQDVERVLDRAATDLETRDPEAAPGGNGGLASGRRRDDV